MERKNFKVYEANLIFFLLAIIFITFGASVQEWDINKGLLITEYGIILLPVILAGKFLGVDLKHALKLNPIKGRTVLRIMGISFLILPSVAISNLIPITILSLFDKVLIPSIPTPDSPVTLMTSFFIVAVSPGICEEVLFRGLILNAYETSYNRKIGAIVAAVLFGFFHFNIQNLFGPIIIGLMAAYLMQVTNSLYAAIVLHMTNNGIAVLTDFISQVYTPENMEVASAATELNDTSVLITAITSLAFLAIIGLFFSRLLINGLKRDSFYYALGEPFEINGNVHYLVGKAKNEGRIISKSEAFEGATYNLDGEKTIGWRILNRMRPRRIHPIWEKTEIAEPQHPKVFAPLVGAMGLYLYIMYLFLTYTG
jgi:membrane protease YdiL (CAAX protease family)